MIMYSLTTMIQCSKLFVLRLA